MTFREKLLIEHPDKVHDSGACVSCPTTYGYEEGRIYCSDKVGFPCRDCWDREIPDDGIMTFAKKRMEEKGYTLEYLTGNWCPYEFGYEHINDSTCKFEPGEKEPTVSECMACWNRPIPEETYSMEEIKEMLDITDEDLANIPNGDIEFEDDEDSLENREERFNEMVKNEEIAQAIITSQKMILDSGERRQFETGAVRDIQEGKGRCDLMPLEIISSIMEDPTLSNIYMYQRTSNSDYLVDAVKDFSNMFYENLCDMFLELSIHFEEGAKKYGENNWQKGIPTKHYIDSGVRHYLKWIRGDKDEPHDRAFVWNMVCCLWTIVNKPELDSYRKD